MADIQEKATIKNIIFDMGNVLIRFEPELFLSRYSLSEEEKRILPRIPEHLRQTACDLIEHWDEPLLPVEGSVELVKALKASGYRLYLFSNACARQHIYWRKAEASSLFDGTLISSDVKMLKPEAEIYHVLFKKFSLNPSECLFIDDTVPNIEASMREGMDGIVFNKDHAELRRKLVQHGVRI